MTVDELIKRSLRLIKVIDAGAEISAEDAAIAIPILNQMMARWEEDGVAVGWADVDETADTVPGPNSALRGIAYNFALELAPEYDVEPSRLVMKTAMEDYAALQRDSIKNSLEPSDMSHLPNPTGGRYDINSDS